MCAVSDCKRSAFLFSFTHAGHGSYIDICEIFGAVGAAAAFVHYGGKIESSVSILLAEVEDQPRFLRQALEQTRDLLQLAYQTQGGHKDGSADSSNLLIESECLDEASVMAIQTRTNHGHHEV